MNLINPTLFPACLNEEDIRLVSLYMMYIHYTTIDVHFVYTVNGIFYQVSCIYMHSDLYEKYDEFISNSHTSGVISKTLPNNIQLCFRSHAINND